MENNYYLILNGEKLFIGSSPEGWYFQLASYPNLGLNSLEDWKPLFKGNAIVDENNNLVPLDHLMSLILDKKLPYWSENPSDIIGYEVREVNIINDLYNTNYKFYSEYLDDQNAKQGKNGLLTNKDNLISKGTYEMMSTDDTTTLKNS